MMISPTVAKRIEAKCREAQLKIEADIVPRKKKKYKSETITPISPIVGTGSYAR